MARLVVLGLSHRTAPVRQREKAALDGDGVRGLLRGLMADPRVDEAAALSTCNRTEVYVVSPHGSHGKEAAEEALVAHSRISAAELACAHYAFYDDAAARHLFRVTGGLDSMVLGESEVQGQVRAAAQMARDECALGPLLHGLFRQALGAGGRVRRETGIAAGPTSVSSLAVDIAGRALPDLRSRRILLVGAGRMAESTGRALQRHGAQGVVVANRTLSAARELAVRLGGRPVSLGALAEELALADVVVCSTGAPHPIVGREEIARALAARPERPLVLIDLSVPRDVAAEVAGMNGALLYDLDDLERELRHNIDGRRRELARADAIVADEAAQFRAWCGTRLHQPALQLAGSLRRAPLLGTTG
jgi:glutamyl-tRNA reductase